MSGFTLRVAALVAAFAVTAPRCSAQPVPAGELSVDNKTGGPVAVLAKEYTNADGKNVELSSYWHCPAGTSSKLSLADKPIVARSFTFALVTADGTSVGWKTTAANGSLRVLVDADCLATHQKQIAARREAKRPGYLNALIRVPSGAEVWFGTWKALVVDGVALYASSATEDAGTSFPVVVKVVFTANGQKSIEERTARLAPDRSFEWDCRDIASPDKKARTAQYVWEVRQLSQREFGKLGENRTLLELAAALETVSKQSDEMPTRGLDEDALRHNQAASEAYAKLAKEIRAGKAGEKDVDGVFDELKTRATRVRALMTARYGDDYEQAVNGNGKLTGGTSTSLSSPVKPTGGDAGRADRIRQVEADLRATQSAIGTAQDAIKEINQNLVIGEAALAAAALAYDNAGNNAQRVAILIGAGIVKNEINDLRSTKSSWESNLRQNQDKLRRLQQDLYDAKK